jgi:hypothetical protein
VASCRLVEASGKADAERGPPWARIEAAYRVMSAMAGDLRGFEEAARPVRLQSGWLPAALDPGR